jgi:hypothetical protein
MTVQPSLCHIAHVWANCKQLPRCLCGSGHLHKEPQKGNTHLPRQHAATAGWRKEKTLIPPIIGAVDARDELQKKKSQRTPRTTTGRVFSSSLTTPGVSFVAALRGKTEEQQQPQIHKVDVAGADTMEPRVPAPLPQHEQETTGQSVGAPNVNSLPLDQMLRAVVTVVQHFIVEFNGAVLEEAKIVVITKIVLNLMEQNGH